MKYPRILIAMVATFLCTAQLHADILSFSDAEVIITPKTGAYFDIIHHSAWAWSYAEYTMPTGCGCSSFNYAVDVDIQPAFAEANATARCFKAKDSPGVVHTTTGSEFASLSSSLIRWRGYSVTAGGIFGSPCDDDVFCLGGNSYGANLIFTVNGDFCMTPPACPEPTGGSNSGRVVDAELYCINKSSFASYVVNHGSLFEEVCSTLDLNFSSGSYSIDFFTISINDAEDDRTDDSRFNQDDVDYLSLNVPSIDLDLVNRFDFDNSGSVDSADVSKLQCFVDACLDARRIGDADCDNDIVCDDLALAFTQPFAGEDFTGATYRVGFDIDLDGDNDVADKIEVRTRFLEVEPAEYVLDGVFNNFDISAYMMLFNAGDPLADVNGDSAVNFFDVNAFLNAYNNPNCLASGT